MLVRPRIDRLTEFQLEGAAAWGGGLCKSRERVPEVSDGEDGGCAGESSWEGGWVRRGSATAHLDTVGCKSLGRPADDGLRSDRGMRPDGEAEREGCNDGAASGTGCADDVPEVVCVGAVDEEHGRVEMVSIRQGMWMGGYTHV